MKYEVIKFSNAILCKNGHTFYFELLNKVILYINGFTQKMNIKNNELKQISIQTYMFVTIPQGLFAKL